MNPIDLILDVNLARNRIAERKAGDLLPEDIEVTLLHLDSVRFHLGRGDQTRAEYEYQIALNFVNTLILAQENADIRCFKQKYFVIQWVKSKKMELTRMFRDHEARFKAEKKHNHWLAQLDLVKRKRKQFSLTVVLPDDCDRFIITTIKKKDPLFITESINPNLDWVFRSVNRGLASLAFNHSVTMNVRKIA